MNPLRILPAVSFIERHLANRPSAFPGREHNPADDDWIGVHDQFGAHWPESPWARDFHSQLSMLSGIDVLMGALGVTVSTDKTNYKVGERPTYRISGGVPRGHVAWTSFKNGVSTGEFQADYPGEDLNDSGTLVIQGGPWAASDVGDWQKQILIVPENYAGDESTLATGQVSFTVSTAGSSTASGGSTTAAKGSGIFDSKITLPLVGSVPLVAVVGIGALAIFGLMGSGGGKR
jgi:hypothetical protein